MSGGGLVVALFENRLEINSSLLPGSVHGVYSPGTALMISMLLHSLLLYTFLYLTWLGRRRLTGFVLTGVDSFFFFFMLCLNIRIYHYLSGLISWLLSVDGMKMVFIPCRMEYIITRVIGDI